MHYYAILIGAYEDQAKAYIMHEKNFSQDEFIRMYNEAIESIDEMIGVYEIDELIEYLVEHYGFVAVKEKFGVYERGFTFTKVNDTKEDTAIFYDDVDNY